MGVKSQALRRLTNRLIISIINPKGKLKMAQIPSKLAINLKWPPVITAKTTATTHPIAQTTNTNNQNNIGRIFHI